MKQFCYITILCASLTARGLDLIDEDLLSLRVSVPVDNLVTQFNFFTYQRAPNSEVKQFSYPSFKLNPPKIEVMKMEAHLTPLASFLDQNKTSFTYLSDHSRIKFTLPFSNSFSYSLPISNIKSLHFHSLPSNDKKNSLIFEGELEFTITPPSCNLTYFKCGPSPVDRKIIHKLSEIHWLYKSPVETLIYSKKLNSVSPVLNDYFPECLLDPLEFITPNSKNKSSSAKPVLKKQLSLPEPVKVLTKLDLTNSNYHFTDNFTYSQNSVSFFLSPPTLLAKPHFPFLYAMELPIVKANSPSIANITDHSPRMKRSPTSNLAIYTYNSNLISDIQIHTEYFEKSLYLFNCMPRKLHYKCSEIPPLKIAQKPLIFRAYSSKIISPQIHSYTFTTRPHQELSPSIIGINSTYQFSKKLLSPKLEKRSSKETFPSYAIPPIAFSVSSFPLVIEKEPTTYLSVLKIPSPLTKERSLKNPYQISNPLPKKNSTEALYTNSNRIDLTKIELNYSCVIPTAHIEKIAIHLKPSTLPSKSKSQLYRAYIAWNFPKLPKANLSSLPLPKDLPFAVSKENSNLNSFKAMSRVCLTLQSMNHTSKLQAEPNKIAKTQLQTIIPPVAAKSFIPYNLKDNTLDILFALYADKAPSFKQTIFNNPEIIIAAFQENITEKEIAPSLTTTCSFDFPLKLTYQIPLIQSSAAFKEFVNKEFVLLDSRIPPKEGVFPETQFLSAGIASTSMNVDTLEPNFRVYTAETAPIIVTNDVSITPPRIPCSSIIDIPLMATLLIPPIPFNDLCVPLHSITEFSSFAFIKEEALMQNRRSRYTFESLAELPSLEFLQTYSLSDEYKVDAHILAKMDRKGYAFSLQISPYDKGITPSIPNHVYFILDKSTTIENHRFEAFKNGLIQSINHLGNDTSFNIITFDQNYERISLNDLAPTKSSIQYVKKCLEKVSQKSTSSFSALISALEDIQKQAATLDEPHTVILLTNGHFLKNFRINRESLYKIFHTPSDNFSIFTAAISDNNNSFMLESLAKLGRGEFLYSQTHSAFPRKLSLLMKRLQKPIATDLSIYSVDPDQKIHFAQNPHSSPLLFANKPYTIYGTTEKLENIQVIIQAKSGGKWINIVKKIDLSKAEKGKAIDKELASRQALTHLMNFIFTNDQTELLQAKEIIKPFDLKWPIS